MSENEDIRREYNVLRVRLAEVMREIHVLAQADEEERDVLVFDEHKAAIDEDNVCVTGVLDTLIREERITAIMGTSLMNDMSYAHNVVWNLADMGKALYGAKDVDYKEAEESIALTDEDISEMRQDSVA